MPPDTVMVPVHPPRRIKRKAPFSSVVVVSPLALHSTVAPLKCPLVATPDEEEKTLSEVGQAVSKTGKVNAKHTRLKALGAERKPEAVMKISFGNDEKYKVGLDKLLVVTVSTL
jgi:predicted metal-dependent RNase